jgi:hypothetical protein
VKLHRAITLAVLILVSVLVIAGMTADGIRTFNFGSLAALLIVVAAAAIAGIAFSWRRYFPRRR